MMDNSTVFKAFGVILRELRQEKGLSQEALALEAGFDRTFISRIERGLTQPSLVSLLIMGRVLDISASAMVALVEEALI